MSLNKKQIAEVTERIGKPMSDSDLDKYTGVKASDIIKYQCIIVSTFNVVPPFKRPPTGNDAIRRYKIQEFNTQFTFETEKIGTSITTNGIVQTYRLADKKVDEKGWEDSLKCAMLLKLLQKYQQYSGGDSGLHFPRFKCIEDSTLSFLKSYNHFEPVFNKLYIRTGDSEDVIKRCVISDAVRYHEDMNNYRSQKEYSSSKFDEWLLLKMGLGQFEVDGVKNRTQIIRGYKKREDEEEVPVENAGYDSGGTTTSSEATTVLVNEMMTPPPMPIVFRKK